MKGVTKNVTQQPETIQELLPSFGYLKQWSGKQEISVIFDSVVDGDGGNNVLMKKVIDKSNLYFITFDDDNNIFGGYIEEEAFKTNSWITDPNSFIFSLKRNGIVTNNRYNIRNGCENNAFILNSNIGYLYAFGAGNDIHVNKIGDPESYCNQASYGYNGEKHPFTDKRYSTAKRIVVLRVS
ncbi:TLDc domain-containing protein [Entamoeba marina]